MADCHKFFIVKDDDFLNLMVSGISITLLP